MSEFDENEVHAMRLTPAVQLDHVWVEHSGSITIHLTVEEAEKLAHALPFTNALAKEIREALRTGGPMSPMIVY
jgi:hypothetical protein